MTILEERFTESATPDTLVGERVRTWMYRRGLNQLDIANVLGIGGTTVSRKLSGKTSWSVNDLVRTAALLDVSISDLLADDIVELEKTKIAHAGKAKAPEPSGSEASHLVAGAGFEPTTSGL